MARTAASKSASSKTEPAVTVKPADKLPPPAAKKKQAAKPALKPLKKADKPAEKAEPAVKEKSRKPKLVRDSFTMPEEEYAVLSEVKKACLKAGVEVKKSELLRVGVALIRQLDTAKLKEILAGLPVLKAGRPKKSK